MTNAAQTIAAENFFALDMRVGRVAAVEPFPEARKPAWKIQVDFGDRGLLWTSAQVTHYGMDELLDRLVIGVVNLEPKRIAGFSSEFLLLGSYGGDGVVWLLAPEAAAEPGDAIG